jgi:trimethylamine:corrinoid methyltransferase-like protein
VSAFSRKFARGHEILYADLLDRHTSDQWLQLGKPSMYSNARKKVEEILASPLQDPLTDDVSQKLEEILARADQELE